MPQKRAVRNKLLHILFRRAAIFGLFAVTMLLTHVQLILSGRTTVESFAARDQREREDALLQTEYGYFWHNMEKRKVRKKWKEEWGGSPVDGRWRYGTRMDRWKEEMGISPLGWIRELFIVRNKWHPKMTLPS